MPGHDDGATAEGLDGGGAPPAQTPWESLLRGDADAGADAGGRGIPDSDEDPDAEPGAAPGAESAGETEADSSETAESDSDTSRVAGWGRVFRGNRALWIVAGVAVVALVAGLLVGTLVARSDAAEAPKPGLVTVPVEYGQLTNDVTIRADVGYADAVEVTIDTSSVSGPAVVTGQVPAAGAQFSALSIALEIAGRPVIVLPGELPAYRTLRFGVSGPDVVQLKHALASVGIDPGDLGSAQFDQATANAVAQLYASAGYPAPPSPEGADEGYQAAQSGVRSAEDALASARQQLAKAGSGPDPVQVLEVDNRIASLQRQIAKARTEAPDTVPDLEGDLAVAQLQREQLFAGADTSAERSMVQSAQGQVSAAYDALERARQAVQPYLPSSEVLFLTELPRRVDDVKATRGAVLQGVAMTVSGAAVRLTGAAAEADARLLTVGAPARFELPDGTEVGAKIAEVTAQKQGERWKIVLEPDPLTPEQVGQVQGSNVRVRIGVGSTEGDVLSVPLAALSAGPGGESRVEVVDGDPREGAAAKTRLVVVEPGLAARGAVEVTPVDGELAEGDLVVVGR